MKINPYSPLVGVRFSTGVAPSYRQRNASAKVHADARIVILGNLRGLPGQFVEAHGLVLLLLTPPLFARTAEMAKLALDSRCAAYWSVKESAWLATSDTMLSGATRRWADTPRSEGDLRLSPERRVCISLHGPGAFTH